MFIISFLNEFCNLPVLKPSIPIHACRTNASNMDSSKMRYLISPVSTWGTPTNK